MSDLNKVFNPGSVAVIGASETSGKASERRSRSLIEGGYRGEIYLINPNRPQLFSRKAYPTITEVGKEVDLVMVVVSPKLVASAVADSVKMGAKGVVIITAGLGETGEEGKKVEAEILKEASRTGAYVIGPNCSGIFSASADLNLLGVPPLKKGGLSVLAQSGNVIDSLTHYGQIRGIGFSKIISAGNAIGVKLHEYIEFLGNDPDTHVIMTFLEGIQDGNNLVKVAREVTKEKPIISLKAGRTKAGARAAASHTGSLAGDDVIVEAAFKQAGIIRLSNVDEMFDVAETLLNCPLPRGNRVAILSEGGGDNSIAADHAERCELEVPVLAESSQEKIRPFLLAGMPASNPIDYGGTAEENPHMITECVNVCMQDDQVDGVLITGFFGGFKDIIAAHVEDLEIQTSNELVDLVKKHQKPLIVHTSFANEPIESLRILKRNGIPVVASSGRAVGCLSALMKFALKRRKMKEMKLSAIEVKEKNKAQQILQKVKDDKRTNLLETEARDLLAAYGVPLPPAHLATSRSEAAAIYEQLNCPVAAKIVSADIIHKSDVGGVRLNLGTRNEVEAAFDDIWRKASKVTQHIAGVLISPMAAKGQECIIGMVRERMFGPVIMFGLGGIFVEVLEDVSFRVVPPAVHDIDGMVKEIRGYQLLTGIRGEKPKDVDVIKDILAVVAQVAIDNPEIQQIDLNPVIVHKKGASVVDARILLAEYRSIGGFAPKPAS